MTIATSGSSLPWLPKSTYLHECAAPEPPPVASSELANRWRDEVGIDAELFEERLRAAGLSGAGFEAVLTARDEASRGATGRSGTVEPAPWQQCLQRIFAEWRAPSAHDATPTRRPFASAVAPFIHHACRRVIDATDRAAIARGDRFEPSVAEAIASRLTRVVQRTLALELNVARMLGTLGGETEQDRYRSFCAGLEGGPGWLELFDEYQVLARNIATTVSNFVEAVTELIERLAADWPAIREQWPHLPERPDVAALRSDGDEHRAGRTVWIVDFVGDEGAKLVYKPRSLAAEQAFGELVRWVDARGAADALPSLRACTVLDRGDHGWVEWIPTVPCESSDHVRMFYRRQGALLALLHLVRGTDMHFENLIPCGEHPVLIDLETLCHPQWDTPNPPSAMHEIGRWLGSSVLGTLLLPNRMRGTRQQAGVEVGGLGSDESHEVSTMVWDGIGTDGLRLVRRTVASRRSLGLPCLDGRSVPVTGYESEVAEGFGAMASWLAARKPELLGPTSPLQALRTAPMRLLVRPTQDYADVREWLNHPDLLRDAFDADRALDRLWRAATGRPILRRVVPSEQADLRRGDIPAFTFLPHERHLWDADGHRYDDVLDRTGWELVLERLEGLDERAIATQLGLVRASLDTATRGHSGGESHRGAPIPRVADHHDRARRCIAAAEEIGRRVIEAAFRGEDDAGWIGAQFTGQRWSLGPAGPDLYDGTAGIALFLAHLAHRTRDCALEAEARRAWKPVQACLQAPDYPMLSGFAGRPGIAYVAASLAELWNDSELLRAAVEFCLPLADHREQDTAFDVLIGSAGAVLVLTKLSRLSGDPRCLTAAQRLGEHLAASATAVGRGVGWPSSFATRPLLGYGHGAAGVADALHALARSLRASGAEAEASRFDEIVDRALTYERDAFAEAGGKWLDYRKDLLEGRDTAPESGCAWCHGATGLAIGRARMWQRGLRDATTAREIEIAVSQTLAHDHLGSHCLCHGGLGNLVLVDEVARIMERSDWQHAVEVWLARILAELSEQGPRGGVPLDLPTYDLMTGLSGIGYALLRLADPEHVPNVLALA